MNQLPHSTQPPSSRLPEAQRRELEALRDYIRRQYHTFVGYPCRGDLDYSELYDFLAYPVNNVGDPFAPSTYRLHTREIERKVLAWFAELTHIPEGDYWGYVTNGGTEGNIYGLFLAREILPEGIVYYSEDTHYSVAKNLRVLRMKHIMIKSQPSGEIDYDDLRRSLEIHRDAPPIIFANIGTTMTEAVDDIAAIRALLHELAIPEHYIHCDAALDGMTLPFQDGAPVFDFRAGIDSISISGHKFIGSPIPCGIVLAKKRYVERIARSIEYVGTLDTTLTGSRNAITPLFLWYAIHTRGAEGFRREVAECIEKADYAIAKLAEIGVEAWRNPFAITVVFPAPPASVLDKWQIAVNRGRAHIITLQSITREQIDELVADIAEAMSKAPEARVERPAPPVPAEGIVPEGRLREIFIVTPNRPGLVADISEVLGGHGINIESLDAEEVHGLATVVLTVDRYDDALRCLRNAGFDAVSEDALVVRIKDEPGSLARLSRRFKEAGINLRCLRILRRHQGLAWIALSTPSTEEAKALVEDYTA